MNAQTTNRRVDPMEAAKSLHEARQRAMTPLTKSDLGSAALQTVVEDIAQGSRATVKRARRVDPLDRLRLPSECKLAAMVFRQAHQHMEAGRGLGPLPWEMDVSSRGSGEALPPQMRALSAATKYRIGVQAIGLAAAEGVVNWVLIAEHRLRDYDTTRRWRRGRGAEELEAALTRLSKAYGLS